MKYICKGLQPPALLAIHKDKSKTYVINVKDDKTKSITVKTDTLNALMRDQGYICCYCMQQISTDGLTSASKLYPTIEHYIAQTTGESKKKNLDTDYKNMLAVCHGNDKKDPKNKHCDSSRGSSTIQYLNPLMESCERVLGYAGDGSIFCMDESHKSEIESDITLFNLNFQKLKESRKSVILGTKKAIQFQRNKMKSRFNKEKLLKSELLKCNKNSGKYIPFVQVKIYQLEKLLG